MPKVFLAGLISDILDFKLGPGSMIATFNSVYYCMQSLHMIRKVYCGLGGNKYLFIYYECHRLRAGPAYVYHKPLVSKTYWSSPMSLKTFSGAAVMWREG